MKKLLIIMTLFISSFFLFNGDVKADVTISDGEIDTYITDDFLASLDVINSRGYKVVVINYTDSYRYFIFNDSSTVSISSTLFKVTGVTWYKWSGTGFSILTSNYSISYGLSAIKIIYSSFDVFPTNAFNVIYNDLTYSVGPDKNFITYYDIYEDLNSVPEENPHQPEIDKLSNFYSLVIDKLSYLAEAIVSNYIYLSIIVIFILIFIFKLIFRRYL